MLSPLRETGGVGLTPGRESPIGLFSPLARPQTADRGREDYREAGA